MFRSWKHIAAAFGAIAVALGTVGRARAHPEAAESPEWQEADCIEVVDLESTDELLLPYGVPFDDTEYEVGDIVLDDAKTHQFFAFRGALAPYLLGSQLFPFDRPIDETLIVPEWLDDDDVARAADASDEKDSTFFTKDQVGPQEKLQARDDLQPYWLTITEKSARVPIVAAQAAMGLRWNLSGVLPGVYQVAGYVYSPPYNAWAPRSGVIVLVAGAQTPPPAVTVDPIDGFLFAGQGRRVRGCAKAGAGARIETYYRNEDTGGGSWQRFAADVPIEDGRFELCWTSPDPDLSGVVRVRVDVVAEDGKRAYGYSPDTMVVVGTGAACTESTSTCCAKAMPEPPAMLGHAGAMAVPAGSGGAPAPPAAAGTGGSAPPAMAPPVERRGEDSGCRAAHGTGAGGWSALFCALAWLRRRRRC